MKNDKARIIVDQIKMKILLLIGLLSFSCFAKSKPKLPMSGVAVCDSGDYLFKNYFYVENQDGSKSKDWYEYYPIVDESISVIDVNVTLIKEVTPPAKVRIVFIKEGDKSSHLDKTYDLKRVDREFYFTGFDYLKDIPNPQKTPGQLHMVLLDQKNVPLCRVSQKYRSISYD